MLHKEQTFNLDPLTKTWTEDAAKQKIQGYLAGSKPYEADTLFLVQIDGWRELTERVRIEVRASLLQQAAFLLRKTFRHSDLVARIGEDTFLVYALGCQDCKEAQSYIEKFHFRIKEMDAVKESEPNQQFQIAALICSGAETNYDILIRKAEQMLAGAKAAGGFLCGIDTEVALGESAASSVVRHEIPDFPSVDEGVDTTFITELANDLFMCQSPALAIEMALAKFCRYFEVDQAYVTELSLDNSQYENTYHWSSTDCLVINKNLNVMPFILASDYGKLFEENGIFVCNCLPELERYSRIMALRQGIRGTQSMMQSAILENGDFVGYIAVCDQKKERIWTRREIMTYSIAGKIISASILQMRSARYSSRIAYQDTLTKAWNMNQFLLEVKKMMRTQENQAIVTFDVKNFKVINMEFSYGAGNLVLIEISNMLRLFVEKGECYARMEADCFVLFLYYKDMQALERRIAQLIYHVEHLAAKMDLPFPFVCMAGVSLIDNSDKTVEDYMEQANVARKSIKDFHSGSYAFFDKEAELMHDKNKYLTSQMKSSLKNKEFIVYYQPKVLVTTGEYIGLEALVRWQRPGGEVIRPDEFIPLFEKNGFITEIDLCVFEQVCSEIRSWIDAGQRIFPVAVNISRVHILEKRFLENLIEICKKYQVPVEAIELEITETAFLANAQTIVEITKKIKDFGFCLSMDDFGTGYSSLSMLKDIPVDILKLDKDFFRRSMNRREKIIISNVIHMAKELEIQVISEGIETKEHEEFLKEIGCDMAQGYLYERPAPIEILAPKLWKN